jgi:endonuclease/exonuclease/phosphatase family metal-dependent hydrolase
MTYNIRGQAAARRPDHIVKVAEVISEAAPDVIGLQEVHCRTRAAGSDQAETLARLTGLNLAFGRSCALDGGDYGNAVLTRGTVTASEVFPLPGAGEPRSVMRADIEVSQFIPRAARDQRNHRAVMAHEEEPRDGTPDPAPSARDKLQISFFVTHLAAWGRLLRRARLAQIARLGDITAEASLPHVLVGDFNVTPRAEEMRLLMQRGHLRPSDAFTDATFPMLRQRLDYVFVDPRWSVARSEVLHRGPSDHWPVVVTLNLEQQ